jgi:hypothetical protein
MRTWLAASLLVGTVVTLSPSSALAACALDDLAGQWDSYTIGNTSDEPFWERCGIRFSGTGGILSGSTCRTDTGERSSLSGRFVLNSNCRVTATLTQQFPGEEPNVCDIPQATLSQDKESLAGVGSCEGSNAIFLVTMIRR